MIETVTKPDWWYVGYDQTSHWNLDLLSPRARQFLDKIVTVFAVNRSEVTHCCEITPSYWMKCVSHEAIFKPEVWDEPDVESICEELFDFTASVNPVESDGYMHSKRVDDYIDSHSAWSHQVGNPGEDFTENDLYEQWNSNPKF